MGQLRGDGRYVIDDEDRRRFAEDGFVHLAGVLHEHEVAEIEITYDRFLRREIEVPGKDYCDMAGDFGRDPTDFSIVNVMLPRTYFPEWRGNMYERRTADIAQQLCGDEMVIDYDQLLAKMPHKTDAVFAWHQDMAYWPATDDRRTATFWLAVDHSTVANGCMRFVPATTHEDYLRPHAPVFGDRGESHALATELRPDDTVVVKPIARGDCTVHNERVMHGSGGNETDGYRRAYIIAYRSEETVRIERELGFTHSHNDHIEVLEQVGVEGETTRND
jgi:phytanoyl-CoA hydroxylase